MDANLYKLPTQNNEEVLKSIPEEDTFPIETFSSKWTEKNGMSINEIISHGKDVQQNVTRICQKYFINVSKFMANKR